MSLKNEFTKEEWGLLKGTPALIGSAMAGVDQSGFFGMIKEAMANAKSFKQVADSFPESELIQGLAEKPKDLDEAKANFKDFQQNTIQRFKERDVKTPEQLKELVLEDCKNAAQLLSQKASESEVKQYKDWALSVAKNVAEAAKEGGFLGFGGELVSEKEQSLIAEIKNAFNINN